jgi:hypothetical protein
LSLNNRNKSVSSFLSFTPEQFGHPSPYRPPNRYGNDWPR